MSSFRERYGNLTVAQAIEMNEAAKLTYSWGPTTETEDNEVL